VLDNDQISCHGGAFGSVGCRPPRTLPLQIPLLRA
jgi:hypothetical protein